ncbi:MAG TPA: CoA ester lyase [Rhodothermales bacterium]|nr:CoA ester lyase [Rhodothermales bacterium]
MRRSFLFMPATDRPKAEKAATIEVDVVVLDLEDGTALSRKEEARQTALTILKEIAFGNRLVMVRINDLRSPFWQDDLAAFSEKMPDGIVIAKTEASSEVEMVAAYIEEQEQKLGIELGRTKLFAVIESSKGLVSIREIAMCTQTFPRLSGLIFGAEDYAGSIGATRTKEGVEILFARSRVVMFAKAFGLDAIDTIYGNFKDLAGLEVETNLVKNLGFTGKLAIHPCQVPVIHQVLRPSEKEIEEARQLINAYKDHQKNGHGVFSWNGRMIDAPNIIQAEEIIIRANLL